MPDNPARELLFNFHDLAGIRVLTSDAYALDFFRAEYGPHQVDALPVHLPLVELHFTRGSAAPRAGYTRHMHKFLARWIYQITIGPDKIVIRAQGNRFALSMIHHMLLHPSLRYLVSYHSAILLHAAGVACRGRSLILVGRGGVGKTTTTSMLLARGGAQWGLHADDYVFVTAAGESLAYLTRAHLYRSLAVALPQVRQRLTFQEKIALEFFGRLRQWSREGIKWPVRVSLARLWDQRQAVLRACPAGLVILQRQDVPQPELHPLPAQDALVDELLEINFNEARHFLVLTRACLPVAEWEAMLSAWKARERALLEQCVHNLPLYALAIPIHLPPPEKNDVFSPLAALIGQEPGHDDR